MQRPSHLPVVTTADREDVRTDYNDGDWELNCWFRGKHALEAFGVSDERIEQAIPVLLFLYPKERCRELLPRFWDRELIAGLFRPFFPTEVLQVMEVALDIVDLGGCAYLEADHQLIADLRDPTKFAGASFEVRVAAAVKRAGLTVRPVKATGGRRTPDLQLDLASGPWTLEVKLLEPSALDQASDFINHRVRMTMIPLIGVDGVVAKPCAGRYLESLDAEMLRHLEPAIVGAFRRAVADAVRAEKRCGTYSAGVFGLIDLSPGDEEAPLVELLEGTPNEHDGWRLLKRLSKAVRQSVPGIRHLAVVRAPSAAVLLSALDGLESYQGPLPEIFILVATGFTATGPNTKACLVAPKAWKMDEDLNMIRGALEKRSVGPYRSLA